MADNYGAAISWIIILMMVLCVGLLYMMLTPLIDTFIQMGQTNGTDPTTMQIISDAIKIWFPIVLIFSAIVYGWRRSNRITGY